MKPIKRVAHVKDDMMVKGQFYKCAKCGQVGIKSEAWQLVMMVAPEPDVEEVKVGGL